MNCYIARNYMNDLQTTISVSFWFGEDCIFSVWTNTYPNYNKGDEIYLSRTITPIGQEKFKGVERLQEFFIVEKVVHSVEQTVSDDFLTLLKVEVHLKREAI